MKIGPYAKKIILSFIALPIIMTCNVSFAQTQKIILRGQPIVIQNQNGVYVPAAAVTTQDYYYFTIDNTKRVCYPAIQQSLENEKVAYTTYAVRFDTGVVNLYCYDVTPQYFIVQ
jgi:hypothetical protein